MQQCTFVVLALLASPVVGSFASNTATAWLQSHKSPTNDQLGELATANPQAFAIVSALLNKHAKHVELAPEERGPDVFRNMMTPRHLSAASPNTAVPYASAELAEVSHPVVDQAHFNPNAAADRDESAVSRLLGAVAQLGGKKGAKIALLNHRRQQKHEESNSLTNDASLFADATPTAAPVQAVEAQVAAAVAPPEPEPAAPAAPKENSYLKGIDLSGDMPAFLKTTPKEKKFLNDNTPDRLTTFSFDDAAPTTPAPKKVVAPKPKKENMFLKWLSGTKKVEAPVAEEKPVEKKAAPSNPYAGWLGN